MEWSAVWISLKTALTAVLISLPFAIAAGYALARIRTRWKALLETIVFLPLVLPPVVTGYLLLIAVGRHGPIGSWLDAWLGWRIAFTWMAAALASAVVSFPLMVRSIRIAFQGVDRRLEMAARNLGASRLDAFFTVSFPLAARGVIAGAVLGFARALSEFGATIMVAGNVENETQTIPLAIYSLVQRPHGVQQSWRLVFLSILLACTALAVSELLEPKRDAHDDA